MSSVNFASLRHEFRADADACMDAPQTMPAGSHIGGDAAGYTCGSTVQRDGQYSEAEQSAFAALFSE